MDENKIKNLIQNEIRKYMTDKQFNPSKIANHLHNGKDTNKLPISSIDSSIPITGTAGGVFDPVILNTQKINNQYTSNFLNPNTVFVLPVNIIYGFGVGIHSAFNGGNALPGTMVFFENSAGSSLWINTFNGWRGVSFPLTA